MKTTITAIALAITCMIGSAPQAEARHYHRHGHQGQVYISGYRSCGTPVYTERYVIRYKRCGAPVWGYRRVAAPRAYCPPPPPRYHVVPACPPPVVPYCHPRPGVVIHGTIRL
jgi:hypothetical protein